MAEPFTCSFGVKSVEETQHEGQDGLLLTGYATRFGEVDQSGEHMTKGALRDLEDTWGQQPIVLFEHGLSELGTRRIGQATWHHIDPDGLRVSVFVPKEPGWKDQRAVRAFRDVYAQIKRGVLRGFSVGGTYTRDAAGAIKRWSMLELSVVSKPCLPSATFAVGAKAVSDAYGALPAMLDDEQPSGEQRGTSMPSAGQSVAHASVVPLSVPAGNVTVSAPVASAQGGWTLSYAGGGNVGWAQLEAGAKAITKAEPDPNHPSSHYLWVGDPAKPTTWKLRYKDADGNVSPRLLGACHAALSVGYRGNKVDLPDEEKQRCLSKLKTLYKQAGLEWPEDEESKSGKKAALVKDGVAVLRDFERGRKQGRQHSAATLAKVKQVIDLLEQHFGLADEDDDEQQAEEESEALVS